MGKKIIFLENFFRTDEKNFLNKIIFSRGKNIFLYKKYFLLKIFCFISKIYIYLWLFSASVITCIMCNLTFITVCTSCFFMLYFAMLWYIRVCTYSYNFNINAQLRIICTYFVQYTQLYVFVAMYIGLLVISVNYLVVFYACSLFNYLIM